MNESIVWMERRNKKHFRIENVNLAREKVNSIRKLITLLLYFSWEFAGNEFCEEKKERNNHKKDTTTCQTNRTTSPRFETECERDFYSKRTTFTQWIIILFAINWKSLWEFVYVRLHPMIFVIIHWRDSMYETLPWDY